MNRTREQIKSLRLERPEFTLTKIGSHVGKSRERVRQVLKEEGLPTSAVRPNRTECYCLNCGKARPCGNEKFCSRACFQDYHRITLRCEVCGKEFKRTKGQARIDKATKNHTFCSKTCYGRWLGTLYGLGSKPEEKLDSESIRQLYDEGYNGMQIARLLDKKRSSVYSLIYRMGLKFRRSVRAKEGK